MAGARNRRMNRGKLILAMTILAHTAVPAPALAWVGGHGGGHEFRGGQERFEHFHRPLIGLYPYPYYADSYDSPPACYWQEGYWGPNQPYLDQYGFERFEPVWIPAQWVCD